MNLRTRIRNGCQVLLPAAMFLAGFAPVVASAGGTAGHPGEPLSSIPLLRSGFGPISVPSVTTTPNGSVGAPAACGAPEGAAAYRLDLAEPAHLDLTVTEIDVDGLCAVGIYRSGVPSLYDAAGRAPFQVTEPLCADGACVISRGFPAGSVYLIAWPKGDGPVSREVALSGSVRGFTDVAGRLTGADIGRCRRIERGQSTTFSFSVDPPPQGDEAKMRVRGWDRARGESTDFGFVNLAPNGTGSFTIDDLLRGYHDLSARFPGSLTRMPERINRCVAVRGKSLPQARPLGERNRYDDYAVWNDGDRVRFEMWVRPMLPATKGVVDVRIEREIGVERYTDWRVVRWVEVEDGIARFSMPAVYRPDGLPFYRIRAEWRGSNTHAPAVSPWRCFQINRRRG